MGVKRSPKSRTEVIFDAMRHYGFHPVDIQFGSGYFIFEHGKDMIVHFHVKEIKGWKFGIWWNVDGELKFDFFTQFEREIDKFKPTASTFVSTNIGYYDNDMVEQLEWSNILPILRFIKKRPYSAWSIDGTGQTRIWDSVNYRELKCHISYIKYYWKNGLRRLAHERLIKKYLKLVKEITDSVLIKPEIIDGNTEGWISCPRFHIVCEGGKKEKLKSGGYLIEFDKDLDEPLQKKIARYNKKFKKVEKRCWEAGDVWLGDKLYFTVKKKGGKK